MRARDCGLSVGEGMPGAFNSITDVAGVLVGHSTITADSGLAAGAGPARTGVTVILPTAQPWDRPLFAGFHRLSGVSEVTGLLMLKEWGTLNGPIALTNTWSVGTVRDALAGIAMTERGNGPPLWGFPVVAETWDGILNDIAAQHVRREHVEQALSVASSASVAEGNVGGGTGMICHGFKGGIGSSSRVAGAGFTVGVLVQTNHGHRRRLRIDGVPVGHHLPFSETPVPDEVGAMYGNTSEPRRLGSIIVVVATDAPLSGRQCSRLAQRASLGIGRSGGAGENWSGDMIVAFSTANSGLAALRNEPAPDHIVVDFLADHLMDDLFYAVIDATEEAIWNALLAAETMTGRNGNTVHALTPGLLQRARMKCQETLTNGLDADVMTKGEPLEFN